MWQEVGNRVYGDRRSGWFLWYVSFFVFLSICSPSSIVSCRVTYQKLTYDYGFARPFHCHNTLPSFQQEASFQPFSLVKRSSTRPRPMPLVSFLRNLATPQDVPLQSRVDFAPSIANCQTHPLATFSSMFPHSGCIASFKQSPEITKIRSPTCSTLDDVVSVLSAYPTTHIPTISERHPSILRCLTQLSV